LCVKLNCVVIVVHNNRYVCQILFHFVLIVLLDCLVFTMTANLYIPETKLRLAIKLWSDMRNFVSFFLFAITVVFSNLLLSKITINLHLFTYTRLEIYTPSSAFFPNNSFQKFVS
jgi:hypothetical protein